MSIATEITRLQTAKADLKTAIEGKGVTVPSATKIDGYADLVESIETGGGGIAADDIAKRTITGGISLSNSVTQIKDYAFNGCSGINSASGAEVTSIGQMAFSYCTNLKSVNFPKLSTIGNDCFRECTKIENADFSNISTITSGGFRHASLKGCLIDPVTVNDSAFRDALNMTKSHFSKLTTVNQSYAFAGAFLSTDGNAPTALVFPRITGGLGSNYAFAYNSKLEAIDFGLLTKVSAYSFYNCSAFNILIIRTSTLATLQDSNTPFQNTPFASGGTGGTLYVPQSLTSQYAQATNWSTVLGYANNQVLPIEGSIYETQYADGTPISA